MFLDIIIKLCKAYKGYCRYKKLIRIHPGYKFVLFINDDLEYSKYGVKYLVCLNRKTSCMAVLKKEDVSLYDFSNELIKNNIRILLVSEEYMKSLAYLFMLKDIGDKFIVVSSKFPYDTGVDRLLGIHNTTKENIVMHDFFKLDMW